MNLNVLKSKYNVYNYTFLHHILHVGCIMFYFPGMLTLTDLFYQLILLVEAHCG